MLKIKLVNDGELLTNFEEVDLLFAIQGSLRKNKAELVVKNVYKEPEQVQEIVDRLFYKVKTAIKNGEIHCEFDNEYKNL